MSDTESFFTDLFERLYYLLVLLRKHCSQIEQHAPVLNPRNHRRISRTQSRGQLVERIQSNIAELEKQREALAKEPAAAPAGATSPAP